MAANKSVEKTLKILELISKYPEGITLSDIYKELGMPKATVYDILQALYKDDAIYYKEPHLKTYVIGSKIFAIGQAYTKNSNFINFASPLLKKFADKYGLTVFANKRLADKIVSIYKYESTKTKITTNDVGIQTPLTSSVSGKVFLAFASETRQKELLKGILEKEFRNKEKGDYTKLLLELDSIKNNGFGIDNGVSESYICSFAVPVFNFENKAVGVISAIRLVNNETEEEIKTQIDEFIEIANYVSQKQGYKK